MRTLKNIGQHILRSIPLETEFDPLHLAAWKLCQIESTNDIFGFQTGAQIVSEVLYNATMWTGYRAHHIKLELEKHLSDCSWVMLDTTQIKDTEYKQSLIQHIMETNHV